MRAVDGIDLEVRQGEIFGVLGPNGAGKTTMLAAFVRLNPVSHLVSATRDLANHAVISSQAGWTLLACAVLIVIFAPLSVLSYQRHV